MKAPRQGVHTGQVLHAYAPPGPEVVQLSTPDMVRFGEGDGDGESGRSANLAGAKPGEMGGGL